jgi:dTDP-4-amino-4,6-dideoxygalactose transaminase
MDAIQAAFCNVKMNYLEQWLKNRQAAAARYDSIIDEEHLGSFLKKPTRKPNRNHTFNQYVVRVGGGERDALVQYLRSEKIGCEIYYPLPLHLQECLQFLGHAKGDFPTSEMACNEVMALPMFPEITAEQQRLVIRTCASFLRQKVRKVA